MNKIIAGTVALVALAGSVAPSLAQSYGGYRDRDYGYDDRGSRYGRGGDYDTRRGYDDRGGYDDRRDYGRRGGYGFDAAEYLRCNPDVRRAIQKGQMESAEAHYRVFGRREGRRLSC